MRTSRWTWSARIRLGKHLTLQIEATDENGKTYTILFGLGYLFNPGTWTTEDAISVLGSSVRSGTSAVLQVLFFPDWIDFNLYHVVGGFDLPAEVASFEVRLTEFGKVTPNSPHDISPYNTSYVGAWPHDIAVTSITMSYVATDDVLDREAWGTDAVSPKMLNISYGGEHFSVPYNAGSLLLGFDGVELNP